MLNKNGVIFHIFYLIKGFRVQGSGFRVQGSVLNRPFLSLHHLISSFWRSFKSSNQCMLPNIPLSEVTNACYCYPIYLSLGKKKGVILVFIHLNIFEAEKKERKLRKCYLFNIDN